MPIETADYVARSDLAGLVQALTGEVKKMPMDTHARFHLGQALLLSGAIERADTQFDLLSTQDPSWGPKVALIRQLLRGLKCRSECFADGRPPEILKTPGAYLAQLLRANAAHRAGAGDEAARLFEEAETLRPPTKGEIDGTPFGDWRDLDDRTAGVLEFVTSNGKYYWACLSDVREIEFAPPSSLRDLALRQAEVEIIDGPTGVVYLPTIYWNADAAMSDEQRLGRVSDWSDGDQPPIIGSGRRCILVDDEVLPFGEGMKRIVFAESPAA